MRIYYVVSPSVNGLESLKQVVNDLTSNSSV